ncbi:hypothetical protein DZA51_03970 [Vibrio campbellii]|nr:hypothetical protein DZA51_03970 [Vibrio campbellii]
MKPLVDEEILIQKNIMKLSVNDIPIVSYFGSGSALLGSILIKLGLNYIEGYQEELSYGSSESKVVNPLWRSNWEILDKKDDYIKDRSFVFFKAHHYPKSFSNSNVRKVILLVRDCRDALISYYRWRVDFLNDERTFNEFLESNSFFGNRPYEDWAMFCSEWLDPSSQYSVHMVFFEQLKFNPLVEVKKLLSCLNLNFDESEIIKAIEETRFYKLRAQEDNSLSNHNSPRIFRKGLIGEWRDVYSNKQLELMSSTISPWMHKFGYISDRSRIPMYQVTYIVKRHHLRLVEKINNELDIKANLICDDFGIEDIEFGLGDVTINLSQCFETTRAIQQVNQHFNFRHYILSFSENEELPFSDSLTFSNENELQRIIGKIINKQI